MNAETLINERRQTASPAGDSSSAEADRRPPRLAASQEVAASPVTVRTATAKDVAVVDALVQAHVVEGHLLPRQRDDIARHIKRFSVAVRDGRVVGCAELAPLGVRVAEVRSLVVDRQARGLGLGRDLVSTLRREATAGGFDTLCAFTHDAGLFVRLGFSVVPHSAIPEKIAHDCRSCPLFGRCGQHAVELRLAPRAARGQRQTSSARVRG
jgi:amino-acid N-acetyltransferase